MSRRPPKIPQHATHRCPITSQEIVALQSLHRGNANDGQQRMALSWLINMAGGAGMPTYQPGQSPDTIFMVGRRFVADAITRALLRSPQYIARLVEREAELEKLQKEDHHAVVEGS